MKKAKSRLKILAVLPAILLLFSCNPLEDDSTSASMIIIESILGTDSTGAETHFLESDVVKNGEASGTPTVYADTATASLKASFLDPAPILGPSQYGDIQLTRYVVSYSRTDGKNRQGVDVPYSFEGTIPALLKTGSSTKVSFIVVRGVAKMEPPLVNLVENRAEGILKVTAKIEFYGHDMTNHNVKATGYLDIHFANYAD